MLPVTVVNFDATPIEQEKEEDGDIAVMASGVTFREFSVFVLSLGALSWFFTLEYLVVSAWSLTIMTD